MNALAKLIHEREMQKITMSPSDEDMQLMKDNCMEILEDIMKMQEDLPSAIEDKSVMMDFLEILVRSKL